MRNLCSKCMVCLPALLFLCCWQLLTGDSARLQFLYGSPLMVVRIAVTELQSLEMYYDSALTLFVAVVGLMLGCSIGTVLGFLMWISPIVGRLSKPYVAILGAIPAFVLAPMLIIWFGTGLLPKIVLATFSVLLLSMVQAYEGARDTNSDFIELAKSFGASRAQVLLNVVFPSSASWVLTGFRLNIGFALIGAFLGEFVIAERGLGRYILRAAGLYDTPRVLFGLLLMASISLLLGSVASRVQQKFFPYILTR